MAARSVRGLGESGSAAGIGLGIVRTGSGASIRPAIYWARSAHLRAASRSRRCAERTRRARRRANLDSPLESVSLTTSYARDESGTPATLEPAPRPGTRPATRPATIVRLVGAKHDTLLRI